MLLLICIGQLWVVGICGLFYEMESEMFVFAEILARKLEEKFHCEKDICTLELQDVEDCDAFCRMGCKLCN